MPTIHLRHFAALRERRGAERESLDVADGTTVRAVYATLFEPVESGPLPVACLRNRTQVDPDASVHEGDEIAFLPPFGGG